MEAEFVKHSRYSLWSKASSFFLLALRIRLSGKLHDLNYNKCILERFPTQLFLVLNLAHMPEHPFLLSGATRRDRRTLRIAGNYTRTVGGNMGPIVSGTEALGAEALAAEALATEDVLAAEALATEEAPAT